MGAHKHEYTEEVSRHTRSVEPTPVEPSGRWQFIQEEAAERAEGRKLGSVNSEGALKHYKEGSKCLPSKQFIHSRCDKTNKPKK